MNDSLGLDDGSMDLITLHDGTVMQTHGPVKCAGTNCCIHSPSDHPLRDAPLIWLGTLNLMMRVCEHGHPHPDPDSIDFLLTRSWLFYDGWHPCCGHDCCAGQ